MKKQSLIKYVKAGKSIREIAKIESKSYTSIKYWLIKYSLKTKYSTNRRSWSDEDLISSVKNSISKAEVIRKLGLSVRPGNYDTINRYIKKLNLSTKHFTGKAHGTTGKIIQRTLEEILVKNSSYKSNQNLKPRLIEKKLLLNKCYLCGMLPEWQGKPIVLVLDHINSINDDYRIKNLRFLCPNCNSQEPTFCRRRET